jgi:hypothetical protein
MAVAVAAVFALNLIRHDHIEFVIGTSFEMNTFNLVFVDIV